MPDLSEILLQGISNDSFTILHNNNIRWHFFIDARV